MLEDSADVAEELCTISLFNFFKTRDGRWNRISLNASKNHNFQYCIRSSICGCSPFSFSLHNSPRRG
ncbi:hypothetical protein LOK49_LG06G03501 [Camellia lanceoleosa]|uniref:Uncharacterized protein n=1 Tax=Camellia lanceoleosa TaxID=1840588 RepID=A0ACC0H8G0_9ERIC|nr:hypothetical protein LOK49_LG06G03501 [Camellia lanceoleosa]